MNSTIWIEAINNFPSDDWSCSAYIGFRNNGANIRLFEDIKQVSLNRYTVLIASIENTHWWMNEMGWKIPPSMTIPDELNRWEYLGRTITKTTLKEALKSDAYPYFVKSYELKKFIPGIISKESDKKWFRGLGAGAPEVEPLDINQDVLVSDIINMEAEYRVYVLDGKVVGCCYYNGNMFHYPDLHRAELMIDTFKSAPKFYSLDLAVTDKEETVLIECNDGYALGNYGLSPKLYSRGLVSRWRELLEQNPVIL